MLVNSNKVIYLIRQINIIIIIMIVLILGIYKKTYKVIMILVKEIYIYKMEVLSKIDKLMEEK
jgi:hypothetical protein